MTIKGVTAGGTSRPGPELIRVTVDVTAAAGRDHDFICRETPAARAPPPGGPRPSPAQPGGGRDQVPDEIPAVTSLATSRLVRVTVPAVTGTVPGPAPPACDGTDHAGQDSRMTRARRRVTRPLQGS